MRTIGVAVCTQACQRLLRSSGAIPSHASITPPAAPCVHLVPVSTHAALVYKHDSRATVPCCSSQVPMHMTAEQLRPQFEPFGNVEEVTIIYDKSTHLSKGERPSTPPLNATRRQFAMQTCDLRSSQIPSAPPSSAARSRLFGRHLTLLLTLCAACSATLPRRLRLCHLFHRGSGARCYRRAEREMHAGEAPARGRNLKPHQPCLALAGYLRRPPSAPLPVALASGELARLRDPC